MRNSDAVSCFSFVCGPVVITEGHQMLMKAGDLVLTEGFLTLGCIQCTGNQNCVSVSKHYVVLQYAFDAVI